jgi:chromosome partition protein MukF
LLQEIQQVAATAKAIDAEVAAQRVGEQVDRMVAWGSSRQHAWSGYYQYVHRFLRDVVRLDPDRALSQRLLEQVRSWRGRPFSVVVASDACIRVLRAATVRGLRSPVGRPREDREKQLAFDVADDDRFDLERLVQEALTAGSTDLSTVTRHALAQLDEPARYLAVGRIAAIIVRLRTARSMRERPWVAVSRALEIEDWTIGAQGELRPK